LSTKARSVLDGTFLLFSALNLCGSLRAASSSNSRDGLYVICLDQLGFMFKYIRTFLALYHHLHRHLQTFRLENSVRPFLFFSFFNEKYWNNPFFLYFNRFLLTKIYWTLCVYFFFTQIEIEALSIYIFLFSFTSIYYLLVGMIIGTNILDFLIFFTYYSLNKKFRYS